MPLHLRPTFAPLIAAMALCSAASGCGLWVPHAPPPTSNEPDVGEPNVSEPNVGEPDVREPNVGEPDVSEPDITVLEDHPFEHCTPTAQWETLHDAYGVWDGFFDVTPNDRLLLRGDGMYTYSSGAMRTQDGSILDGARENLPHDVDDAFATFLTNHGHEINVRNRNDGTNVLAWDASPGNDWATFEAAALSSSAQVGAVQCNHSERTLVVRDLYDPGLDWSVVLDVSDDDSLRCGYYEHHARVFMLNQGAVVTVDARIFFVTSDGIVSETTLTSDDEPSDEWPMAQWPPNTILGADVDHVEDTLAVTTADGVLHLFSLPALDVVDTLEGLDAKVVNTNIYATPTMVSPVRFARHSSTLAVAGAEHEVWVLDAQTLSRVATLDVDADDLEDPFASWNDVDTVVSLAWGRQDDALYIFQGATVSQHACAALDDEEGTLTASIGIGEARVAQQVPVHASHQGGTDVVVYSFYVDGDPQWGGGLHPDTHLYFGEPGVHLVEVVVDDGVRVGHAATTVEVLPAN